MRDDLLFVLFPYAALALLIGGTGWRMVAGVASDGESQGSEPTFHSLYHGSRTWRRGVGTLVLGHLVAFLVPRALTVWDSVPVRLAILEIAGYASGLLALVGLIRLVRQRFDKDNSGRGKTPPSLRAVVADALFLTLLGVAIVSGLIMASTIRWGSSWYVVTVVPYLRSLATLHPDVNWVAAAPPLVRLHLLAGSSLLAVLPFTALGDVFAGPIARWLRGIAGAGRRSESRDEVALS